MTVPREMNSFSPICRLVRPSETNCNDLDFGRREARPPGRRPFAFTPGAPGVRDRILHRERGALGESRLECFVAEAGPGSRDVGLETVADIS